MFTRRSLLSCVAALALAAPAWAEEGGRIKVVTSFSILGDVVANVGGDRIDLLTLVGPDGDAHVFQPSPADADAVAAADLLVVNGLGFEGWIDRLIEASGTKATVVVAAEGLTPLAMEEAGAHGEHEDHAEDDGHDHGHDEAKAEGEAHDHGHDEAKAEGDAHDHGHDEAKAEEAGHDGHDHGEFDPHAWQAVPSVLTYVANIEAALAAVDPEGAEVYKANAATYRAELEALDQEIRAAVAALPGERRTVVTSHDSFGYFAAAYGLTFVSPQGMSTEAEASARDVAALITQIREQDIGAVFVENIADRRLLDQIASETGAVIGGTLYSDALSGEGGPATTYVDMMRHNLAQLTAALGG